MNELVQPKGMVSVTLFDQDGNIKEQRTFPNLIVTTGLNFIASRMTGTSFAVMDHIAVGTDGTTATLSDTGLLTEVGRMSVATATASGNAVTFTVTFGAGVGTGALQEAGIFNQSSGGTMLARTTFSTITKGASDVMNISWTVTVG